MDPSVVWTQEQSDMMAGAAEAVKHGAILDAHYLAWIKAHAHKLRESDTEMLSDLVARSVRIKSDVVQNDPFEAGERAILNFGHTIGHALESATRYEMSHGHAVARGMVVEARVGEAAGVTEAGTSEAIIEALDALGLPARIPAALDVDEIMKHTRSDKKARGGTTRYVMLQRVGVVARSEGDGWTWSADDSTVREVIRALAECGGRSYCVVLRRFL
jgi:3-dehydroquinate synthase